MLPRPDPQSFTRLLISLGVFLCFAAFVGPGLVLRDTGTLRVTQTQMDQLTPVGRAAMTHRQQIAADAGEWAPWAILILFVPGVVLVAIGAPRLLKKEGVEQEHASAMKDKLQRELKNQAGAEVGLSAQVTESLPPTPHGMVDTTGTYRWPLRPVAPAERRRALDSLKTAATPDEVTRAVPILRALSPPAAGLVLGFARDELESLEAGLEPGLQGQPDESNPLADELRQHDLITTTEVEGKRVARLSDSGHLVARVLLSRNKPDPPPAESDSPPAPMA